jgi:predicted DNA-binding transcriptional regulator YafY
MNQTERLYRIDQLLHERGCVSVADLMRELEVSLATLKRDLAHLRDRLHAPIVFDRDAGGYRFVKPKVGPRYQLPGLWFSAEEVLALMTMYRMLESMDTGGLLGPHIKPLMTRLSVLLESADGSAREMLRRIHLLPAQARRVQPRFFEVIGAALVKRRRLQIDYFVRSRNEHSSREVSPLRLVHYRGNWYLDAWCHKSEGIRMFSLDAIERAAMTDRRAKDVSLKQVDEELAAGYGIYRGTKLTWATLVFSPEAARWVRAEVWHPRQQTAELPDGRYELKVPYSESAELEMDILRHGENVQVAGPPALRAAIARRLRQAAATYAA